MMQIRIMQTNGLRGILTELPCLQGCQMTSTSDSGCSLRVANWGGKWIHLSMRCTDKAGDQGHLCRETHLSQIMMGHHMRASCVAQRL